MNLLRKVGAVLGVKGFICIASLVTIAVALVTYTTSLTINPTVQFSIGATSGSWTVYINDVDKTRYLPGSLTPPVLDANNPNTYAFKVETDTNQACAVKIELTSAVDSSKFSKFQIIVKYWDGSAWTDETLYADSTGSTTKPYIDGLANGDSGYVYQPASTTKYYLIKVTYSYDKVGETTQVVTTFRYTPLPQNSS